MVSLTITPTDAEFRREFDATVAATVGSFVETAANGGEPFPMLLVVAADGTRTIVGIPAMLDCGTHGKRTSLVRDVGASFEDASAIYLSMLAWSWRQAPGQSTENAKRGQRVEILIVYGMTRDRRSLFVSVDTGRSGEKIEPMTIGPVPDPVRTAEAALLEAFWA